MDEILQKGGTLTLISDLTLSEPMVIQSGATVTLNLNGHTIKNNKDIWDDTDGVDHWSLISVQGGKLTITGEGQMIAKANDCFVVDVRDEGEVTIENGFFNGNISAVYVFLGKAYIKGGKFAVQQKDNQYTNGNTFLLNIYDTNRDKSLIEVTGGTFVGVNPGNTNAEGPQTNFIKAGYHVQYAAESTSETPVYEVVKDQLEGYSYVLTDEELEAELMADGSELKIALAADINVNKPIVVRDEATVTLNLNGHTIKNNKDIWDDTDGVDHWSLISVQGGKLTITGEGQMIAKANDCFVVDVRDEGEVTIENGFFNGNISAVYVFLGKAYIKGGKFAVQQKDNQYTNGNTFLLNIYDTNRDKSLIEVTGGTFVGVNPGDTNAEGPSTNFIKAGYHAEETEDSTNETPVYKVVKDNNQE